MERKSEISDSNVITAEKQGNRMQENQANKKFSANPSIPNDLEIEDKVQMNRNEISGNSSNQLTNITLIKERNERLKQMKIENNNAGKQMKSILKTPEKTSSKKQKGVCFKDKIEGNQIDEVKEVESYKQFNVIKNDVVTDSCCCTII